MVHAPSPPALFPAAPYQVHGADVTLCRRLAVPPERRAAVLFDAVTAQLQLHGESLAHLAEQTRTAYISRRNFQDEDTGVAARLLHNDDQVIGAIGFEGL